MTGDTGVEFAPVREFAPGMGVPRPVAANDSRIPPPAADLVVWTDPGSAPILVSPQGQTLAPSRVTEEDMPKKIGIFATKDDFAVSVLDDDNDPVDGGSFKFAADVIVQKVKPLLEAAGHKVVDQTFGSLHEAASEGKVTSIRRSRAAK